MSLSGRAVQIGATVAAMGAGVTGGVLFGFSAFVMRALDDLPAESAIRAMQSINRHAPSATFMTAMFGTAAVSVALGVEGMRSADERSGQLLVAGAAAYLSSIAITAVVHVPRNDRLAQLTMPRADALDLWYRYSTAWTTWNHVRAACAIAGSVLFMLALQTPSSGGVPAAA